MKEEKQSKAWGVASLVTGIIGILCIFMPYFGLPLSIIAVYGAGRQNKEHKIGIATAGNVLGIIGIILNSIMLLIVLFVLIFMGSLIGALGGV